MADMFSVTVSTFSRVYMTWVRFLALALKGSLPRWPSVQELLLIVRSFFYTKAFISKRTKSIISITTVVMLIITSGCFLTV